MIERERTETGGIEPVVTIFLTNRECPWRCVMCDLWQTTVEETVPPGAVPAQIDFALKELGLCLPGGRPPPVDSNVPRRLKLYNGGSFFDPHAILPTDYPAICELAKGFELVTVECHPAFVGNACIRFRDMLATAADSVGRSPAPRLEVAMGLETVHPAALERLNKRMTPKQFERAAAFLRDHDMALRVFVLVQPPFIEPMEALVWAERSVRFAFDQGATAVSLIPTRAGNGAMEELQRQGQFLPPTLSTLEEALAQGIAQRTGRVFADLWDLEKFSGCSVCFSARRARLEQMNLEQRIMSPVVCDACGGTAK